MIYTNVEPTNIVSHDEQDIRFLTVSHYYDDNDNMTIKEVTKNVTLLKDPSYGTQDTLSTLHSEIEMHERTHTAIQPHLFLSCVVVYRLIQYR